MKRKKNIYLSLIFLKLLILSITINTAEQSCEVIIAGINQIIENANKVSTKQPITQIIEENKKLAQSALSWSQEAIKDNELTQRIKERIEQQFQAMTQQSHEMIKKSLHTVANNLKQMVNEASQPETECPQLLEKKGKSGE